MKISYQYLFEDGPLRYCPTCGNDLQANGGINLILFMAGMPIEMPTHLDEHGILVDTEDRAVEKGYHSATECNNCTQLLLEVCHEEQRTKEDQREGQRQ